MNERDLLKQISLLKQVEPRENWVFSLKQQILGEEQKKIQFFSIFELASLYFKKPALVLAAFAFVLAGSMIFQQNKGQQSVSQTQVELAQQQLKTIQKKEAEFIQLVEKAPKRALQAGVELVQLQKDKKELEKVLGTSLENREQELASATKTLVESELTELETRTLSEDQTVLFEEAKAAYRADDYQNALEKIWALTNPSD